MNVAPVFDLAARRASQPRDMRTVLDSMADSLAQLDSQVRSQPFCVLTEQRIAAMERSLTLLRGLCSELRTYIDVK